MKRTVVAVLMMAGTMVMAEDPKQADTAAPKELKPQTTCPVMGGAINKALYVDSNDVRIYVCCKGCIDSIKADPAKFIKKLETDGIKPAKLQTTCPVMGEKIDKTIFADKDGKRVYFCGKECVATFNADSEKYIKKLTDDGITLDDSKEEPKKK